MCGIVGIFSRHNQINENLLQKAVRTLDHRGPDCHKTWISEDKKTALGHTRLSIIDLLTGDQPLTNENKKIHAVVNGEFYDYERQREALKKQGHQFSTLSDSEIALHLYEEYGTDCLHHLRGEYAFFIWDEEKQICFAARDRFGVKPLFYSVYNDTLYLASEIKALLAAGIPAKWDEEAMYYFNNSTLNLHDRTCFKNVFQIPPGHFLIAKNNQLRITKYWDLNYPEINSSNSLLTTQEYVDELRVKLNEAIRIRLRADVPVACYLSGGLDSSAVLGMAASHLKHPMPAFTLSFDEAEYDEQKIAREMADLTGAQLHPIPIKQSDLATHFIDAIWHGETFFYNGHGIAKFLLSKAVRDAGYKVVLTGEGADELFAGYPHFRIDQLFHGHLNIEPQQRQELMAELVSKNAVSMGFLVPTDPTQTIHSVQETLGYTPSWLLAALQSANKIASLAAKSSRTENQNDIFKIMLTSLDVNGQLKDREPVNQSLYLWTKFRLSNYILTILGDRMEMAHSVEGRVPFLDHHVAEFMRNVPIDLKIHHMNEKYLLKEAARPVLTKTVYERQKHPFLAPPAALDVKQPFHELLQTTLRGPILAELPFYDRKKVVALLDKLPQMERTECVAWDSVLMVILSTCILKEKFNMSA